MTSIHNYCFFFDSPPPLPSIYHTLAFSNVLELGVVYFNQLSGAARTQKLVKTLFSAVSTFFFLASHLRLSQRIDVTPLPFSPVQFQYNCLISATNGSKRRNLMQNKFLYYRSLPSVTYILLGLLREAFQSEGEWVVS